MSTFRCLLMRRLAVFAWLLSSLLSLQAAETRITVPLFLRVPIAPIFPLGPLSPPTWPATTCENKSGQTDIQSAIGMASDTDTVSIPAGTCNITITITNTRGITITGAGCTLNGSGIPTSCTTILNDDVNSPVARGNEGNTPMFSIDAAAGKDWRLTNFKIGKHNDYSASLSSAGTISIVGQDKAWRIDHIYFDAPYTARTIYIEGGWTYGVIDHVYGSVGLSGVATQFLVVKHTEWDNKSNGDGSWATDTNLGSAAAVYLEASTLLITNTDTTDCYFGGRIVVRFVTATSPSGAAQPRMFIGTHGTESTTRGRGCRYIEAYNNNYTFGGDALETNLLVYSRSGIAMAFNNTTSGILRLYGGDDFNMTDHYPPFGNGGGNTTTCNGDSNCEGADGLRLFDVALNGGAAYKTGMHTGSNGVDTLVTSGLTADQYSDVLDNGGVLSGFGPASATYVVVNRTKKWASYITGNTTTTVSRALGGGGTSTKLWDNGDSYDIRAVYPVLDQVGYGKGALIRDNPPVLDSTGMPGLPNQAFERSYVWSNTGSAPDGFVQASGMMPNARRGSEIVVEGGSPIAVTVSSAALPGTCTIGAGYWKLDEGEWDSTHAGPDGRFYKCTATNTWTLYYTPFTYPHPLTGGNQPADAVGPQGTRGRLGRR